MNTVLSLIIMIRLNSLKKDNNYIIADYIICHIDEMTDKSIKQLSQDCFVSTTSILNFCKLIGFQTYSEFRNRLVSTFKTRQIQLLEKNKNLNSSDLLQHIASFSKDDIDIKELESQINQVIIQIKKYKAIHFYGATFPLALTSSFIEDLSILGIYANTHQDNYDVNTVAIQPGVHVVISLSGRFMEANRNNYIQIMSMKYPSVLITSKVENKGDIDHCIQLPQTISSQYDEIILLLIFDYILLQL